MNKLEAKGNDLFCHKGRGKKLKKKCLNPFVTCQETSELSQLQPIFGLLLNLTSIDLLDEPSLDEMKNVISILTTDRVD